MPTTYFPVGKMQWKASAERGGSGKIPPMQYAYTAMLRAQSTVLNATASYEETLNKLWKSLKAAEKASSSSRPAKDLSVISNMWIAVDDNVASGNADAAAWLSAADINGIFAEKRTGEVSFSIRREEFPFTQPNGEGFKQVTLGRVDAVKKPQSSAGDSRKFETTVKGVVVLDSEARVVAGILVNCCPAQADGNSECMPCRVWAFPAVPELQGKRADIIAIDVHPGTTKKCSIEFGTQYSSDMHRAMETFPPLRHMRGFRDILIANEEKMLDAWHVVCHVPVANAIVYAIQSTDPKEQKTKTEKNFRVLLVRSPVRKAKNDAAKQPTTGQGAANEIDMDAANEIAMASNFPEALKTASRRGVPLTVRTLAPNEAQGEEALPSSLESNATQSRIKPFLATMRPSLPSASTSSSSSSFLTAAPRMFPASASGFGGSSSGSISSSSIRRTWLGGRVGVMQSD
jgi:hypothetical protein